MQGGGAAAQSCGTPKLQFGVSTSIAYQPLCEEAADLCRPTPPGSHGGLSLHLQPGGAAPENPTRQRAASPATPRAQRHLAPQGPGYSLPSAMAGGGRSPPGSQRLAGDTAVLPHLGCGVWAPALLLPSLRAGSCVGLQGHREQRTRTGPRPLSTRLLRQGRAAPQHQSFAPSIWRRGNRTDPQQHSWFAPGGEQPRDVQWSCPGQKAKAGEAEV